MNQRVLSFLAAAPLLALAMACARNPDPETEPELVHETPVRIAHPNTEPKIVQEAPVRVEAPAIRAQSLAAAPVINRSAGVLYPGDQIRIVVWTRPELSGDFAIAQDGSILHPLYRRISAAGVPMVDLEQRVRTFLLGYQAKPDFVISPLFRVFIGGAVRQPAALMVAPGTTLSQAIGLVGGPVEDAQLREVRVVRDLVTTTLDLSSGDSTATSFVLGSSDQVLVPRQHGVFRDSIVPIASAVAAFASLANVIILLTRGR